MLKNLLRTILDQLLVHKKSYIGDQAFPRPTNAIDIPHKVNSQENTYVAPSNGWIVVTCDPVCGLDIMVVDGLRSSATRNVSSSGVFSGSLPVHKGQTVKFWIHGNPTNWCASFFAPSIGDS